MSPAGPSLRRAGAVVVTLLLCLPALRPATVRTASETDPEIRALWVLRTSLTSPANIATLVRSAKENGFNTLLVQIRSRGDAYYDGALEPRAADLQRAPASFDPLAHVLETAHAAGLRVHAWVNVNLVSSAVDLPGAREHLVNRHPEWLMVPRELAQDLATVGPGSPAYVGKLARWARAQSGEIEGLYASPILPRAADHTVAVVREIVRKYAIDGVHLDYARYPSAKFDYGRDAIAEFRAAVRPKLGEATRRQLDDEEGGDVLAYPDGLPDEWRSFRMARMTALMGRLRAAVKDQRASALVTVAAAPDLNEALDRRLQDWGEWLAAGLVDAVCPMAYTVEPERFAEQIAAARERAGARQVWAGIGAYRLTPSQTIDNIRTARRLGAAGVVLFSYDSMTNPRQSTPDYLALVARGAFGDQRASAGSR